MLTTNSASTKQGKLLVLMLRHCLRMPVKPSRNGVEERIVHTGTYLDRTGTCAMNWSEGKINNKGTGKRIARWQPPCTHD